MRFLADNAGTGGFGANGFGASSFGAGGGHNGRSAPPPADTLPLPEMDAADPVPVRLARRFAPGRLDTHA